MPALGNQKPFRRDRHTPLLMFFTAAALLVGIFARFAGLGVAPLDIDEYYFVRSADNIVQFGWPAFPCGGVYTRGVFLQYLTAGLRLGGLSPELAPRLLTAISSLLVFPAAYLLGRRLRGTAVALLTVTVLALSVWEIEMARFARMYAPFQAVFLWHLVFFTRYVVDRDDRALRPMVALTLLGPLIWEGGVFLALINLLAPFLRQSPEAKWHRSDWIYLAVGAVVLALAYAYVTADLRYLGEPAWPPNYTRAIQSSSRSIADTLPSPFAGLLAHPYWLVAAVVPLAAAALAVRKLLLWRDRPLAMIGMLAAMLAGLAGLFGLVVGIVVLSLLMHVIKPNDLFSKNATQLHVALATSLGFWLVYNTYAIDWQSLSLENRLPKSVLVAYQLLSFPDVVNVVVRPFNRSVPILGLALGIATTIAVVRMIRSGSEQMNTERVLLVTLTCLVLAAGISTPPRVETRYVFFLYPIAVMLAVTLVLQAMDAIAVRLPTATRLAPAVLLVGFGLTEDFQPRHLVEIDRPETIFRANMSEELAIHLILRDDLRAIGNWLDDNASGPHDVVIFSYHGLEYYYPQVSYFFMDWQYPIFGELTCARGTVDRWSNRPLLYTFDALRRIVEGSSQVFLVTFPGIGQQAMEQFADLQPTAVWTGRGIQIIRIKPHHKTSDAPAEAA